MKINTVPLYQLLSRKLAERDMQRTHQQYFGTSCDVEELVYQYMPAGNGVDLGTRIDLTLSDETVLVFHAKFHHLDQDGMPGEWSEHTIVVEPPSSLANEIDVKVFGCTNYADQEDINFLMYSLFYDALTTKILT